MTKIVRWLCERCSVEKDVSLSQLSIQHPDGTEAFLRADCQSLSTEEMDMLNMLFAGLRYADLCRSCLVQLARWWQGYDVKKSL
jgi:hypothetical protein